VIRLILIVLLATLPALAIAKRPPEHLDGIEKLSAEGSPSPGMATVYLLRGRSKAGVMMKHNVLIDGQKVGSIRRMNYLVVPLTPGRHTILIDCPSLCSVPSVHVTADFKGDRTYYFINDPAMWGDGYQLRFSNDFSQLDKATAEIEMRGYLPGKAETE
jgi:hypothetical protein